MTPDGKFTPFSTVSSILRISKGTSKAYYSIYLDEKSSGPRPPGRPRKVLKEVIYLVVFSRRFNRTEQYLHIDQQYQNLFKKHMKLLYPIVYSHHLSPKWGCENNSR
jgi:hypothetical protein